MKLIEKLCKEAWDRHVNKREHFPVYEAFFRDGFEAGFRKARSTWYRGRVVLDTAVKKTRTSYPARVSCSRFFRPT